ncbi:hypothetical protein AXF42_Ash014863 [Apostasia shenzhenica]|uniref:Uncharacterized protein n=1 Tax=Apostasia shenzhenica TaxID=1088818 RepID=A0A2I0ALE1_9ASPA|nr:hypothetical protein AXF42_Ash014863 [Apostasia shenzhenica]
MVDCRRRGGERLARLLSSNGVRKMGDSSVFLADRDAASTGGVRSTRYRSRVVAMEGDGERNLFNPSVNMMKKGGGEGAQLIEFQEFQAAYSTSPGRMEPKLMTIWRRRTSERR